MNEELEVDGESDSESAWETLGHVPPDGLPDDRLQLHHAVQLLSAFGQTYLEVRPDDRHRSMSWDSRQRSFSTDPTPEGLWLVLRVPDLAVSLMGSGDEHLVLSFGGRTLEEAREWLEIAVAEVLGSERRALGRREYEVPEHPVGEQTPFGPTPEGLLELSRWYSDASRLLSELRDETPGTSEIRVWPHHFDIGAVIAVAPARGGSDARTVGVGLSPGDGMSGEPYFYVNIWPRPGADALPEIDGPGRWNTDGWVGGVLPASDIVSAGDRAGAQVELARGFLAQRVAALRELLLNP